MEVPGNVKPAPPRPRARFVGRGDAAQMGAKLGREIAPWKDATRKDDPQFYDADEGLVHAVNVALLLEMPLLLTGKPGTGKTQLADRVAWELGFDEVLKFETKSTSESTDLFYRFDLVGRLAAAQAREHTAADVEPRRFISYEALGKAILRANPRSAVEGYLPIAPKGADRDAFVHPGKPRPSVVLIDEIDKASRDFPNDLLNELDQWYFRLREMGDVRIGAPRDMRPVVIITSNSERDLPDPFLRRCIYYNIPLPDRDRLERILYMRLEGVPKPAPLLDDAIAFFLHLRGDEAGGRGVLERPPSAAELINWTMAMQRAGADFSRPLADQRDQGERSAGALSKKPVDQERFAKVLDHWLGASRAVGAP